MESKKFNYFPNHGDEEGNNAWTIIYGDVADIDHIIVGAEDSERSAIEYCKRLNEILALSQSPETKKYPIGGFAPGNYQCYCVTCQKMFIGDKRAVQCEPCATKEQSPEAVSQPNGEYFKKVYCKDELPEITEEDQALYYTTDNGFAWWEGDKWKKMGQIVNPEWWLKPVSLPSEEQVRQEAEKIYPYENVRADQSCGAVVQELLDRATNTKREAYLQCYKDIIKLLK